MKELQQVTGSRGQIKVQQILAAAREVFMAHGYGEASMDTIARSAGVSKATLYAHFAGKEQLFAAIIDGECRRYTQELLDIEVAAAGDVERSLRELAQRFLALLLSPRALCVYRMILAEASRFPELGRIFFEAGPKAMRERLAHYLERAAQRGLIAVEQPELAAEHFIGLVKGQMQLRGLLGMELPDAGGL
ncbi:MAG TPA: TetR/AcrR family transcriptional regulator, partial [Candidatus Competibacteraceae bacterium]|nr:TetR/AcrR family transcriptional regulator [Candidatus Competibacteraceae bacterium]